MKIGIDFSRGLEEKRTGIEEYAYQLVRAIIELDIRNPEDDFFLYVRKNPKLDFKLPSNFHLVEIKRKFLWTQIGLSWEMLRNPVDILFVPAYSIPIIHPKSVVVTIHGLEYERFSDSYSLLQRLILKLNTYFSSRISNGIITPSVSAKKDLIDLYKIRSEKIRVVNHGFKNIISKEEPRISKEEGFNILFVGRFDRRKNLFILIKAFSLFIERQKQSGIDVKNIKLILCGAGGNQYEEIKKIVSSSLYKENIILTGYVSSGKKEELYKNADVFLFPSLVEGFGLPILEAMSFGLPVICSDIEVFKEVAGDAAVFINPNFEDEIASALEKVYKSKDFREEVSIKGYENIKRFSWNKCASETLEFIRSNKK